MPLKHIKRNPFIAECQINCYNDFRKLRDMKIEGIARFHHIIKSIIFEKKKIGLLYTISSAQTILCGL